GGAASPPGAPAGCARCSPARRDVRSRDRLVETFVLRKSTIERERLPDPLPRDAVALRSLEDPGELLREIGGGAHPPAPSPPPARRPGGRTPGRSEATDGIPPSIPST